jgi:glutamate-1-semialdehyde 2,1-aminomutase
VVVEKDGLIGDIHSLIPGGAHTYSRGDDTFPANAPKALSRGKGAYVWDATGRRFIDWGMALRSVSLGHAHPKVDRAVVGALRSGVNMSRPVPEEGILARLIASVVPSAEMVKFGKNGSDATAAAVRLARSATGRELILRSDEPDFLGIHDWFIGSTVMDRGVPTAVKQLTKTFKYGDLEDLENQLKAHPNQVAAVVLEPLGKYSTSPEFLRGLVTLAHQHGALVIFDETVSGFRVHIAGAQGLFDVRPDLSTFGKAIANGYALSALVGRRDVMELGGIRHSEDRTFIMSSTYGSERVGLAAGLATISELRSGKVFRQNERVMSTIVETMAGAFDYHGIGPRLKVGGLPISPNISILGPDGEVDFRAKTRFMWLMIEHGVLLSQHLFSVAGAHRNRVVAKTLAAIGQSTRGLAESIKRDSLLEDIQDLPVQPVFRRKN